MDKQAKEAREQAKNLPFGEKLKYFWTYYKFHVFAVLIACVLIGTTVVQISKRVEYDFEVAYYGGEYFGEEQAEKLKEYITPMVEDTNGDGEVNVNVSVVISDLSGGDTQASAANQATINQKFMAEVASKRYDVYIFDSEHYEYAGTEESEMGLVESAFEMTQYSGIKDLLQLGDENLYWCTCFTRDTEGTDEDDRLRYDIAVRIAEEIQSEN